MSRYSSVKTKEVDGKKVYVSSYPIKIENEITDIYIPVRKGERLDILAEEYYNDVSKWELIANANNLGKGSVFVPVEMNLRIPVNRDLKRI